MRTYLKPLIPLGLFLGSLAVGYIALAWTAPGSNPPANNVLPPLNISGNAQYKTGNLYLGAASSSPFTLNVQANGADLASLWVDNATVLNGATNVNSKLSVGVSGGSTQICLNGDCRSAWPAAGLTYASFSTVSQVANNLGSGASLVTTASCPAGTNLLTPLLTACDTNNPSTVSANGSTHTACYALSSGNTLKCEADSNGVQVIAYCSAICIGS